MAETETPIALDLVAAEFPSEGAALTAFNDLHRWIHKGQRDASAYRLKGEDGAARIVVAIVLSEAKTSKPIGRRCAAGWWNTSRDPRG
jgi:hypothetical protein